MVCWTNIFVIVWTFLPTQLTVQLTKQNVRWYGEGVVRYRDGLRDDRHGFDGSCERRNSMPVQVSLLPLDRPLHVPRTGSSPGRPAQHHHPVSADEYPYHPNISNRKTNKSSTRVIEFHSEWNYFLKLQVFPDCRVDMGGVCIEALYRLPGQWGERERLLRGFYFEKGKRKGENLHSNEYGKDLIVHS